jgi:cytochrome o ubiquinol oxidase subunit 2
MRRTAASLGAVLLVGGCGLSDAPVVDPQGPIALAERDLLFDAFWIMLIVLVPVFVMAFLFVWRYRASGGKGRYAPDWSYSAWMDSIVWIVPALIIVALAVILWSNTHKLDPYKRLESDKPPLEVEAVAQDWKWLFIYPEQGIAAVNELAFPSGRPLSLKITSDTVMNSIYIPALAGQIYAMAGMETRLHLLADRPGRYRGKNVQYSGRGFADEHFEAVALSEDDFDAWVAKARQSPDSLDAAAYEALAKPSAKHPVTYYSAVEPNLFGDIIAKYAKTPMEAEQAAAD